MSKPSLEKSYIKNNLTNKSNYKAGFNAIIQISKETKTIRYSYNHCKGKGTLKAQGIDVIGFGAGEPDFDTPENILTQSGIAAITEWTHKIYGSRWN